VSVRNVDTNYLFHVSFTNMRVCFSFRRDSGFGGGCRCGAGSNVTPDLRHSQETQGVRMVTRTRCKLHVNVGSCLLLLLLL